jgi:hypothetical protein
MATPQDKRYFSKVAGAKFIQPDGTEVFFRYGFYDFKVKDFGDEIYMAQGQQGDKDPRNGKTKAEVYFNELEAVVNQRGGNPLFYTMEQVSGLANTPDPMPKAVPNKDGKLVDISGLARSEAEIAAGDASLAGTRHREVGELNRGPTQTNANDSTADPALRGHFGRAEELRRAAQERALTASAGNAVQSTSQK